MPIGGWIESHVPARLDRLPWSRWHWLIVTALGATWILDGLEVTLAGSLGGILTRPETLGLTDAQVGASATFYLAGAVARRVAFRLRDRSARAQEALLHHCLGLSRGDGVERVLVEFRELCVFPRTHRRGNRRRIRGDQFRDR